MAAALDGIEDQCEAVVKMTFDTSGGGSNGGEGGSNVGVGVGIDVVGGGGDGTGGGGGNGTGGGDDHRRLIVKATIFLPISEGTFVDTDDPLLARY